MHLFFSFCNTLSVYTFPAHSLWALCVNMLRKLTSEQVKYQTLSLGRKSELIITEDVISSKQAIRILSGVAGLSRGNQSLHPTSTLAALMASLMAKNAADARKNGGSPTALDEWMALTFGWPYTS